VKKPEKKNDGEFSSVCFCYNVIFTYKTEIQVTAKEYPEPAHITLTLFADTANEQFS